MPNTLTVASLKKLLKKKHRGRAKGIVARIEEAEGRAVGERILTRAFANEADELKRDLESIQDLVSAALRRANDEPDPEPPTNELAGAIIASNVAQDIASWPITSRITRVEITEQQICVYRTPADPVWPTIDNDGTDVVGNVLVGAYIDGKLHVGTYEWMRPNQRCKALSPEENGGTIATRIGPHVEAGPLVDWVPKAGERVIFWYATLARWGAEKMLLANGQPQIPQRTQGFETTWSDLGTVEQPEHFVYAMTVGEYEKVNSALFRADVELIGVGSSNLMLPPKFTKRRWRAASNRESGSITRWASELTMIWEALGWETEADGRYGALHMIYPIGGGYVSAATRPLWRPGEDLGVVIFLSELPYSGPGLCGFWLGTVGDHPHQRRTDIHPWRFSE